MRHNAAVSRHESVPAVQRTVVLLGSTGSIGTQAVDVLRRHPDRFRVVGLAAGGRDPRLVAEQVVELGVTTVAVADPAAGAAVAWPGAGGVGAPAGAAADGVPAYAGAWGVPAWHGDAGSEYGQLYDYV